MVWPECQKLAFGRVRYDALLLLFVLFRHAIKSQEHAYEYTRTRIRTYTHSLYICVVCKPLESVYTLFGAAAAFALYYVALRLHCCAVPAVFTHQQLCGRLLLNVAEAGGPVVAQKPRYGVQGQKVGHKHTLCGWTAAAGWPPLCGRGAHTQKAHTHTTTVFDLRYALHRSNETAKLHSRLYACLRVCVYVFLGARACSFPVHASRDLFLGSVIILLAEIRMRFVRAPNI